MMAYGFPLKSVTPGRVVVIFLLYTVAIASCTTVKDTPDLPGAGPVIHSLEADAPQSIYGMVATANQESSNIAAQILEAGGNAIDAAVAAALAVGVSDPGDSGLGGTTYILIRFADGRATAIDGSALVPLGVDRDRLAEVLATGEERGMELAAVPASLAALDYAASRYGSLPLADLVEPSIELARNGFYPVAFQEISIRSYLDDLLQSDFLRYFVLENGAAPPSTTALQCRPILARTLRRIAAGGSAEFYRGSIAAEIESDMTERGGFVSREDLAILRVREMAPLRGTYRDTEIFAFPHPSIGGAVIQALNILEQYPSDFLDRDTIARYQVFAEAFHIATVDHSRLLSDTTFFGVHDREGLLAKSLAAEKAALIEPGKPLVSTEYPSTKGRSKDDGHTTQISIVDRWGNAVSITQTLGRFFGNKLAAPGLGFPYNSMLEGESALNARAPIPTFMSPSIVTRKGEVLLVLGSASSTRIPGVVASVISNVVDRDFDLRRAVIAPRVLWSTMQQLGIYAEIFPPITREQIDHLESFGYEPIFRAELPVRQSRLARFGAVNAVHFDRESGILTGVGDPRRDGNARGVRF
jgi:gamma-glutamyltranspeptidase/glutathione hydrolase